jgi:hypothetical protein
MNMTKSNVDTPIASKLATIFSKMLCKAFHFLANFIILSNLNALKAFKVPTAFPAVSPRVC